MPKLDAFQTLEKTLRVYADDRVQQWEEGLQAWKTLVTEEKARNAIAGFFESVAWHINLQTESYSNANLPSSFWNLLKLAEASTTERNYMVDKIMQTYDSMNRWEEERNYLLDLTDNPLLKPLDHGHDHDKKADSASDARISAAEACLKDAKDRKKMVRPRKIDNELDRLVYVYMELDGMFL